MYEIIRAPHDEFPEHEVITLVSPAGIRAGFIPTAGMVGCSLMHDGEELLGQRQGLGTYISDKATFGIPLLAPWANRLGSLVYAVVHLGGGIRRVDVPADSPYMRRDPITGLPIHGLLGGSPDWEVIHAGSTRTSATLVAKLNFDHKRPDFEVFPFEHEIRVSVTLRNTTLTIATTVTPTGVDDVPIAYGWHPYFTLPGVPREEWDVSLPFTEVRVLDEKTTLPTGEKAKVEPIHGPLGDLVLDNLFGGVEDGTTATISGGGREIAIRFDRHYDFAVLWAPEGSDFICVEPMTAPTDPFSGQDHLQVVEPGDWTTATWSLIVTRLS